jgi:outer membrane protein TolC
MGLRIPRSLPRWARSLLSVLIFAVNLYGAEGGVKTLGLEDCIRQARLNHPLLAASRALIDQAQAELGAARSAALLRVDADASYDRLSETTPQKQRLIGESLDDFQAGLVATQPLWTGGRLDAKKELARLSLRNAEEALRETDREVVFGVRSAYYRLFHAVQIVLERRRYLAATDSYLDFTRDLNHRTKRPRIEAVLRIESQALDARQSVLAAESDVATAKAELLEAIGGDIRGDISITTLEPDAPSRSESLDVRNNPAISRAEIAALKSQVDIRTAKSSFYPTVNLRAEYGREFSPETGRTDWMAGVRIQMPLWDWNQRRNELQSARFALEDARQKASWIGRQLRLDADNALRNFDSSLRRLEILQSGLQKARESFKLYDSRYRNGLATGLELLDSHKNYLAIYESYVRTQMETRISMARLEMLAGGDYESR